MFTQGLMPDEVHASTLDRADESARIFWKAIGFPGPITSDLRLIELQAGDWDGWLKAEIYTKAVTAQLAEQGMARRPPNGESMHDVAD